MLITDALVDKLHSFQVGSMALSIESLRSIEPAAKGQPFGSGYATFAGDGCPVTKVYGLGHKDSEFDLGEVDAFFDGLATNWELIVTPFSSQKLLHRASLDGYVPDHFETLLGQIAIQQPVHYPDGVTIEEMEGDLTEWTRTSDSAWSESEVLADEPSAIGRLMAAWPAKRYMARFHGEPAGTASLCQFEETYLFAGASTRPQFRGRGIQTALTQHRLHAAGVGSLVLVAALSGSQSHRNQQRIGFQPLYSELVMFRHVAE